MIKLYCYPKCSTCLKCENFLKEHNIQYEYVDIKENTPNYEELKNIYLLSKQPIHKFYNTSGINFRKENLSELFKTMKEDDILKKLSTDGMLIKRPLLIDGNKVLIGFKIKEYMEHFETN